MPDNDQDKTPLHGPNLILDVENFGPIAEARNVEFRPMTVFVGPSNTGKSYLAMLLHAMLQGMNGFRNYHTQVMNPHFVTKLSPEERAELVHEAVRLSSISDVSGRDASAKPIQVRRFSSTARSILRKLARIIITDLSIFCSDAVKDYFEADIDTLANFHDLSTNVPSIELSDVSKKLVLNLGDTQHPFPVENGCLHIDVNFARLYFPGNGDDRFLEAIAVNISQAMLRMILRSWSSVGNSVYFPAARTGILTSHKLMTDSLLANAHRVGVDVQQGIVYHKVARDFLRLINLMPRDFNVLRPRTLDPMIASLESAAQRLEESVITGAIEVQESQLGPPDFRYVPNGDRTNRLPIFRSSSMVTEIAPIIHFLRTHVRIDDLLIVEEPEAHLHPAAQQKMAAALAYMIRIGLRVLLTTHSHYIVEQLGALVNAGAESVAPDERERHLGLLGREIDRDLYLKQDEVAVYEFEPRGDIGSPSDVTELEFDTESYAYYPGRYSSALADQHNRNMHMVGARLGF